MTENTPETKNTPEIKNTPEAPAPDDAECALIPAEHAFMKTTESVLRRIEDICRQSITMIYRRHFGPNFFPDKHHNGYYDGKVIKISKNYLGEEKNAFGASYWISFHIGFGFAVSHREIELGNESYIFKSLMDRSVSEYLFELDKYIKNRSTEISFLNDVIPEITVEYSNSGEEIRVKVRTILGGV